MCESLSAYITSSLFNPNHHEVIFIRDGMKNLEPTKASPTNSSKAGLCGLGAQRLTLARQPHDLTFKILYSPHSIVNVTGLHLRAQNAAPNEAGLRLKYCTCAVTDVHRTSLKA